MKDCKNTSEEKKLELLREYRAAKKAKKEQGGAKAVRTSAQSDKSLDSTLFRACFADKVEETVCADIGSDINLLPPAVLHYLEQNGAKMTVVKLPKLRSFGLADEKNPDGQNVSVQCEKMVTLYVQLFIRNGTSLWLRNITCYFSTQHATTPLLGRLWYDCRGAPIFVAAHVG